MKKIAGRIVSEILWSLVTGCIIPCGGLIGPGSTRYTIV